MAPMIGESTMLLVVGSLAAVAAFSLPLDVRVEGIPGPLTWHNSPASFSKGSTSIDIASGAKTDWFVSPYDGRVANSAPMLMFDPGNTFVFSAKVQVQFSTQWDAGALMLWSDDHHWAKLAFERSPEGKPTVVTVVTQGLSDDCNSVTLSGDAVYLQVTRTQTTYVFYYSTDGVKWEVVRTFSLKAPGKVSLAFEAQSPVGEGSTARFSEMHFAAKTPPNAYTGK
jgi:regulation of enolase protein 1 (concanavalin A-like superfamily)